MPIAKHLRHFYGKTWRTVTRPRILKRATDERGVTRCEQCGVPNHAEVKRVGGYWLEEGASWALGVWRRWRTPAGGEYRERGDPPGRLRVVRIVLTIAHVNNTPGDDRDENLLALCQYDHLHMDREFHKQTRTTRKDAARPLLAFAKEA